MRQQQCRPRISCVSQVAEIRATLLALIKTLKKDFGASPSFPILFADSLNPLQLQRCLLVPASSSSATLRGVQINFRTRKNFNISIERAQKLAIDFIEVATNIIFMLIYMLCTMNPLYLLLSHIQQTTIKVIML